MGLKLDVGIKLDRCGNFSFCQWKTGSVRTMSSTKYKVGTAKRFMTGLNVGTSVVVVRTSEYYLYLMDEFEASYGCP